MRLTLFNGSPRGLKSNTKVLLDHFADGFTDGNRNTIETAYLVKVKKRNEHIDLFNKADHVIIAFPLYWDSLPSIVKSFIESLEPLCGRKGNPTIGFIVQSGFQEANHSRYVEKYLIKLSARLSCEYAGTIIRGGVEGIQMQPAWMTKNILNRIHELGRLYAQTNKFDKELVNKLAGHRLLSPLIRFGLTLLKIIGLADSYWNMQLKKNKAFEKRFAKPYIEG